MAIQTVFVGTTPGDDTGDPARTCFIKINDNFTQPENAASRLVATPAEALAGTAGPLPDAEQVHAAIRGLAVGTVSQSGGVPTGAIIESGSNANGQFFKYAGGMMICYQFKTSITNITTVQGSLYRSSFDQTYTPPAAFVGNFTLYVQLRDGTGLNANVIGGKASSTPQGGYEFWSVSSSPGMTVAHQIIATGRWY